jgi:hypothetical protein
MEKIPDSSIPLENIDLTQKPFGGLPKRDPGADRFVGYGQHEEYFMRYLQEGSILNDQTLKEHERIKSLEEIEVIAEIFKRIPEFIAEYGAESTKVFPVDSVHLLNINAIENPLVKDYLEKGVAGKYNPLKERIEVLAEQGDYLNLARILIHEAIHANSFVSFQKNMILEDEQPLQTIAMRRAGLSTLQNGEYSMFKYMNEALTEELAKRFCEKYFDSIDTLKGAHQVNNSKKFNNPTRKDAPVWDVILEKLDLGTGYSYLNERIDFVAFAYTLYEKNKDIFESYEDVVKMFSKAMFTGKILDIARLTDHTFGEGMFRKIGIHYLTPSQEVEPEQIIDWLKEQKAA